MTSNKIKIVLADDHQMFLDGLYALLSQMEQVEIVATANNGTQLLEKLRRPGTCDIAIVDLHMEEMDGIETTRQIKQQYPDIRIIGLTMENDLDSIQKMLEAGASGYVLKNTGKSELKIALERVAAGEFYLSQSVGSKLAQNMLFDRKQKKKATSLDLLTEREVEVLKMIAEEMTSPEIAEKLFISPKTVETHRKNLMKKIGVNNTLGIYKFAIQHKLVGDHH
jgi:DNA-binding NarL/FixJ family response regulator